MSWPKKQPKYTVTECLAVASQYSTKPQWWSSSDKKHRALYQFARRNKLLGVCCGHMRALRSHLNTTLEACQESARKYWSKCAWQQSTDNRYYQIALRRGWLPQCCGHMSPLNSAGVLFAAYVCIFPDGVAYVGVTRNARYRKIQHSSHGKVHTYAALTALAFDFKILEEGLQASKASDREQFWMDEYAKTHVLLNEAKAGSLGGFVRRNDFRFEECLASARQFEYRSDWKRHNYRHYLRARQMGWLASCTGHMPKHMPTKIARSRNQARRPSADP